jgi:hypothetical protein
MWGRAAPLQATAHNHPLLSGIVRPLKATQMEQLQPWPLQLAVCEKYHVRPQAVLRHDRLSIALDTLDLAPINGLRLPSLSGSSGWFIYGGENPSDDPHFYQPLCVTHLGQHCEIAVPYLFLPAGWRFQIDSHGYEDVWYDDSLMTDM